MRIQHIKVATGCRLFPASLSPSGWHAPPPTLDLPAQIFPIESYHFGYLSSLYLGLLAAAPGSPLLPSSLSSLVSSRGPAQSGLSQMSLSLATVSHTSTITFLLHLAQSSHVLSFSFLFLFHLVLKARTRRFLSFIFFLFIYGTFK